MPKRMAPSLLTENPFRIHSDLAENRNSSRRHSSRKKGDFANVAFSVVREYRSHKLGRVMRFEVCRLESHESITS